MKSRSLLLLPVLVLLLVGSGAGYAAPPQLLTLSLSGAIFSSGSQQYSHQGGTVVAGMILGQVLDPAATHFHYSLDAAVNGLSVSGTAEFDLQSNGGHGQHGDGIHIHGRATLFGMVPAEVFPLPGTVCPPGVNCAPSAIAGLYNGSADIKIKQGGSETDLNHVQMVFESAFLNPFGGPIFLATADMYTIFIESTYDSASVVWNGISLGGIATGSLAGTSVSGYFGMTVNAVEDLKQGLETDSGTIAFNLYPALIASGSFSGSSSIPTSPTYPCNSPPPPLSPPNPPFPPGTCNLTGFSSSGHFSQSTVTNGDIRGTYTTSWFIPAVAFTSSVTATLKSDHH